MSRWAHWLSTWNRICHCSFVSNRSFLLFSNEYLILWIGGRNFLFSLYFPRFFSLFCRGWLWNSNEYHLQVFCSWEWDSVSYLWSFFISIFLLTTWVTNVWSRLNLSRCQAFWLCLRDSPISLFLLGSLDGMDKTWLIQLQTGRNLDTEECANYSIL